ncbi:hypothetical protein VNO78_10033 [Psophocarpus tetragonolobus]|uniref:Uncharacterized protein n=1 Tax=Psophocarpus tetragonolobus TaxID=3891 RepID=A0AAN9XMD4_PSOTE
MPWKILNIFCVFGLFNKYKLVLSLGYQNHKIIYVDACLLCHMIHITLINYSWETPFRYSQISQELLFLVYDFVYNVANVSWVTGRMVPTLTGGQERNIRTQQVGEQKMQNCDTKLLHCREKDNIYVNKF